MGQIIHPIDYPSVDGPLVFLAGPIVGARDWQTEAIEHLHKNRPEVTIASPRTRGDRPFYQQIDWERHHLLRAARSERRGVAIFYLAREEPDQHECRRAFAQTTRDELAWIRTLAERERVDFVVAFEEGFSGAAYRLYLLGQLPVQPRVIVMQSIFQGCLKRGSEFWLNPMRTDVLDDPAQLLPLTCTRALETLDVDIDFGRRRGEPWRRSETDARRTNR